MSDTPLGFWKIAEANPDHLALVTPDEEEIRAGDLLATVNQLTHGFRELGLQPGDAVAMLLPNGAEVFELVLALGQQGQVRDAGVATVLAPLGGAMADDEQVRRPAGTGSAHDSMPPGGSSGQPP